MTRIGSLFSGGGGLDRAVEAVFGGETIWHCENDRAASKVLKHRWPGVPNLGDITTVDWTQVEPVDVLCGGFPCTDVSSAGRRAGLHGTRSGLWTYFAEAIDVLRPEIVVIENVRGLLSAHAGRPLESDSVSVGNGGTVAVLRAAGAVLGDLSDLGYDAQWATVSAASVGAPHRRERVFVVAYPADDEPCVTAGHVGDRRSEGQPEPLDAAGFGTSTGDGGGDSAERVQVMGRSTRRAAADTDGDRIPQRHIRSVEPQLTTPFRGNPIGRDVEAGRQDQRNLKLLPTPTTLDDRPARTTPAGGNPTLQGALCGLSPVDVARQQKHGRLLPTPCAQQSGCSPEDHLRKKLGRRVVTDRAIVVENGLLETGGQLLPTPQARDAAGAKTPAQVAATAGLHGPPMNLNDYVVNEAPRWGKYEPAIQRWEALTRPAPIPTQPNRNGNPRLNPAFSEWMLGWPKGWVTNPAIGLSRNDQLRIIGNGVVPQQAVAALTYLLTVCAVPA